MSTEPQKTIIEIKQEIQSIVSKLMSNTENTENTENTVNTLTDAENTLIEQISKYKVSNNLEALSTEFGNVLESSNTGQLTS